MVVHPDPEPFVELHAHGLEAEAVDVRRTARSHQDLVDRDLALVASLAAVAQPLAFAGAGDLLETTAEDELDAVPAQRVLDDGGGIGVLAVDEISGLSVKY